MAAPSVRSVASGASSSTETKPTMTYPSSITAGDLLIIVAQCGSGTITRVPGSEFRVYPTVYGLAYATKIADGTESGTFQPVEFTSAASRWTWCVMSVENGATIDFLSSPEGGASTTPNAASLTRSGTGTDTLFVNTVKADAQVTGTPPSGYTERCDVYSTTGTSDDTMIVSTKESTSVTDDPGDSTISSSASWHAWNMAIRPAGFPFVRHAGSFGNDAAVTTYTSNFNVAAGGEPNSGDLIIVVLCKDDDVEPSLPSGWTSLGSAESNNAIWLRAYAKVSDGTENGIAPTGDSEAYGTVTFIIDAATWAGTISDVEAGTIATGSASLGVNPTAFSPSWGADNNLYLSIAGWDSDSVVGGEDAEYEDNHVGRSGTGNGAAGIRGATVDSTSGTSPGSSPGPFTPAEQSATIEIAVKPAATGSHTGSITADAVAKKSQSGSFTADAVAKKSQSGSFTADAVIWVSDATYWDNFTNRVLTDDSFGTSLDGTSWIEGAYAAGFQVNGTNGPRLTKVWPGGGGGIFGDSIPTFDHANVKNTRVRALVSWDRDPTSATGNSFWFGLGARDWNSGADRYNAMFLWSTTGEVRTRVERRDSSSWTWNVVSPVQADTWTDLTAEKWWCEFEVTNDGELKTRVWKDGTSIPSSPSNSGTDTSPITAAGKTDTRNGIESSEATDAMLTIWQWEVWDLGSRSFTADAVIGAAGGTGSFAADAVIKASAASSVTADAVVLRPASGSVTADAVFKVYHGASVTADAVVLSAESGSVTVDAVFADVASGSFTAGAVVQASSSASFTANAVIETESTSEGGSISADAFISYVGECVWVSPADLTGISSTPTLVFTMPEATSGAMHFLIQVDTDSGFSAPTTYQSPGTGWEYWDGDSWEPIPASGVPAVMAGNDARYTVQTPLTTGTWYRRVRAGVI